VSVGAKTSPYRVLFVYERTDKEWKLVQLHFSVDGGTD
jgi:hypothetical protein